MRKVLVVTLAGVLLVGAGCGGDDDDAKDDADATPYVDALAESMSSSDQGLALEQQAASCFAEVIVDAVGVDKLKDADVSAKDLAKTGSLSELDVEIPDNAKDKISKGLKDCGALDKLKEASLSGFTQGLPEDAVACLGDNLDDDTLADASAAAFVGGESDQMQDVIRTAVGRCPAVAAEVLMSGAGANASEEDKACVRTFIETNADAVSAAFESGDEALGDDLAAQIREA